MVQRAFYLEDPWAGPSGATSHDQPAPEPIKSNQTSIAAAVYFYLTVRKDIMWFAVRFEYCQQLQLIGEKLS
jgi:hypothetical protein